MSKEYSLFLDDNRDIEKVGWVIFPKSNWVTVRNYKEFCGFIERNGLPKYISLDHDLAFEHLPLSEKNPTLKIPYHTYKEKTGLDCCKWLINYCLDKNLKLPECTVHSLNPIGRENIISLLENFKKSQI